jgi:endonuclease/exonuclease/phosphatase family metal-dependent hydrolase
MSAFMFQLGFCFLFALCMARAAAPTSAASNVSDSVQVPATFDFNELTELAANDPLPALLREKLDRLLSTPFISNEATALKAIPNAPQIPGIGPVLRVAEWNINRGENEHEVNLALSDSKGFLAAAQRNPSLKEASLSHLAEELHELAGADVLVLDEVDKGVNRTKYHDVARDLAIALNMNYVYATEFIELDRIYLGIKNMDAVERPKFRSGEIFGLDPKRYLGLEGSAILSRYPIRGARIIRLPDTYDWYHEEIRALSELEKVRRWTAEQVFQEQIARQVRRGGRMAVVADLEVPQSPTGIVTVISPHLEDYTDPKGRRRQMEFLLREIRSISNPVILAGDFNTTGRSARPVTIRREVFRYLTNYHFWMRQVFLFVTPVPGLSYVLLAANYAKNFRDPTAFSVPILLSNRSRQFFLNLRAFRFDDGARFDFAGKTKAGYRHRRGTLADSNQRSWKGFTPTFSFNRTYKGLVGEYKIDWALIKTPPAKPTLSGIRSASFTPYLGRALCLLNRALGPRISDHCPITVSLPLTDPSDSTRQVTNLSVPH